MFPVVYRKIVIGLVLIGIVFALPDLVSGLLHSLLSIAHFSYEWISLILEELIGHLFHLNKYYSQLIVFYLWLSIASCGCYCLCSKLPSLYYQFMEKLLSAWLWYKTYVLLYSQDLSSRQRIKLTTLYASTLISLIFLIIS